MQFAYFDIVSFNLYIYPCVSPKQDMRTFFNCLDGEQYARLLQQLVCSCMRGDVAVELSTEIGINSQIKQTCTNVIKSLPKRIL